MLIKMKFANYLEEFIQQAKDQLKVQVEPDPEEKDDNYYELINQQNEKTITDALYNSVIKSQYELE